MIRVAGIAVRTRAAVALGLFVAAAAVGTCGPGGDQPLVVGAVYPLAGPQAPGGMDELAGVRSALELARPDTPTRPVALHVVGAITPEQARAAVDRLVDVYHVPVVIGTYGSTLSAAASGRAEERRTVFWETGAVADQITQGRRYVFRTVATGGALGRMAVEFTSRELLPRAGLRPEPASAVIVAVDDVYGRSVADAEAASAAAAGIRVAERIDYDPHAYDPGVIAARVAAALPDYLWDVSYIDDGIAIWREVVRRRVPLRAAIGTSSAFCMEEFGRALGPHAVGVYAADKPDSSGLNKAALTPSGRRLVTRALAAYGASELTIPAVAGFVGGWTLFHDVLPQIRARPTADAVRAAALQVDEPMGAEINGGGVRFAGDGSPDPGQNLRAPAVVGQWQSVGQMRVVYPASYATAAPRLPA